MSNEKKSAEVRLIQLNSYIRPKLDAATITAFKALVAQFS